MKRALVVFVKELRDHLRDRRTLLTALISAVAVGPLVLWLLTAFIADIEEAAAQKKIHVQGLEHAPTFANFIARQGYEALTAPADFNERVSASDLAVVIVVPSGFEQTLAKGEIVDLQIVFDSGNQRAAGVVAAARALVRGFNEELRALRLIARGLPPDALTAVRIDARDVASRGERAARLYGSIPFFLIMATLVGGLTLAIDSTAGERERASLEPLLLTPATRMQLTLGKWLAGSVVCAMFALLATVGLFATLRWSRRAQDVFTIAVTPELAMYFVIVLVPLVLFIIALLMLLALFGRTFKEAQTYTTIVVTAASFLPMFTLFGSGKEKAWYFAVPVLAQNAMLVKALKGESVVSAGYATATLMALVGAAICLVLTARLLRDERIVFGRA